MVGKSPVVLTWMSVSSGVIFVIIGITVVTIFDRMANMGVSEAAIGTTGAVPGVAVWFVWLCRRN